MKILPILITPLFFLIVFLGVKNLTQKKSVNDTEDTQTEQQYSKKNKNKAVSENKSNLINRNENKSNFEQENYVPAVENKNSKSQKNDVVEKSKTIEKKIDNQEKTNSIKKVNSTKNPINEIGNLKPVLVQFGAFSRKDYAENSKKDIENKIKKKFENITLNINFVKDKKLYKLVYTAKDENFAKSICEFSKNIKINCLIKK